ncbi:endoplasmic reticulum protein [Cyathus striatus]|nr:endoplasmic reticulum protein [Cyathus striatus]
MVPWIFLLLPFSQSVLAGVDKTFGVKPDLISRYVASKSGTWACLDGSKVIPWDFVNDDSCDCPDGSDEPGTGACPNTTFYCRNDGHIGASVPSSRVKDGLCEPQCCDGSDERPGVCKNVCAEVGEEYRKKRDEEHKLRRTARGSKIRSTYIQFAHKEKARLEEQLKSLEKDIESKEKEVERLKEVVQRTESISQAALEHKEKSPLFQALLTHSRALKSLQREHKKHLERENALGDILNSLHMAVLEAVRGWEELAGLPHINDVGKEGQNEENKDEPKKEEEQLEEGMWTAGQLEEELDDLFEMDLTSLLFEHEEHIKSPAEGSILYDVSAYLPDSFLSYYDDIKDTVISWLGLLGISNLESSAAADSSRAQQALSEAETQLSRVRRDKKKAEEDLSEIFIVEGFGAEGEWKKLDGTCLEKNTGDYTYEVCLFNESKQKPNNGGQTFSLGKFESWNPSPDVKPGTPEYYQKQVYKHGTRCWNGPERSTVLLLTCGTENTLLTVQELEKCEYQFTGTTPALCLPVDGGEKGKKASAREEL